MVWKKMEVCNKKCELIIGFYSVFFLKVVIIYCWGGDEMFVGVVMVGCFGFICLL